MHAVGIAEDMGQRGELQEERKELCDEGEILRHQRGDLVTGGRGGESGSHLEHGHKLRREPDVPWQAEGAGASE